MPHSQKKYYHIKSLEKGLKVIELLAEENGATVTQVAKSLGFNRTGSHRFLSTLKELGFVEKNADSTYQLTFKVFEIGMKIANRFDILRTAFSSMQELASIYNETINLGHLEGLDIIHLDKIESRELLRMDPGIGSRAPAHCTALGKAILAFIPREELASFLKSISFKSLTPNTIVSKKRLLQVLKEVQQNGVAFDHEELCDGLCCVAAPIFDRSGYPRYAISVSGPAMRMPAERIRQIQVEVKRVCDKLSAQLSQLKIGA